MSVSRRPSSSRPASAIFLGKLDLSRDPDHVEERSRTSLLPSPPHTSSNSSGAGSTGRSAALSPFDDNKAPMADSRTTTTRPTSRTSYDARESLNRADDDDDFDESPTRINDDEYDEDHTAKLSDDRRSAGHSSSGAPSVTSGSSGGALTRAKSLADRNRAVLDKLASITSGSTRSNSRSPALLPRTPAARDRSPFATSSRSSGNTRSQPRPTIPSRLSYPKSKESAEQSRLDRSFASGSDTEREPRSSDDYSITPPAHPREDRPRMSLDSATSIRRRNNTSPSPPSTLTNRPSTIRHASETSTASTFRGTQRASNYSNTYATGKLKSKAGKRAPLPQIFRDGMQSSEEPESATTSNSGSASPVVTTRDRGDRFSKSTSTMTSQASSSSSRRGPSPRPSLNHSGSSNASFRSSKRSFTVREPGVGARARLSHTRWASEADGSTTETPVKAKYEKRGGSEESAIAIRSISASGGAYGYYEPRTAGRRTLFGEEIRAAGLSPQRERFTLRDSGPSQSRDVAPESPTKDMWTDTRARRDTKAARMSLPNGFRPSEDLDHELERDRNRQAYPRDGVGTREEPLSAFQRSPVRSASTNVRPRTGDSSADRFQSSIRATLGDAGISRPSTSAGIYALNRDRERDRAEDTGQRSAPFAPRVASLQQPRRPSPLEPRTEATLDRDQRRYESPTFRPVSVAHQQQLMSSPSSGHNGEHSDILLDALSLLDANLSRISSSNGTSTPQQANDCSRSAAVLVEQIRSLNTRLRAASSSALEEHVEADLASAEDATLAHEAAIWRGVGTEFRDSLRASDELVRTLTTFFLSFGKILKDVGAGGGGSAGAQTPSRREREREALALGLTPHRRAGSTDARDFVNGPAFPTRSASRTSYDEPSYSRRTIDLPSRGAGSNGGADELGQRLSTVNVDRLAGSDSGRRSLDDYASVRRSLSTRRDTTASIDPYVRSSTSMSYLQHQRHPGERPPTTSPPPRLALGPKMPATEPRRPSGGVFSALSSRRLFSGSKDKAEREVPRSATLAPMPSSSSREVDQSFESDDQAYDSPTPAERNKSFRRTLRRSLPFSSERPVSQRPPLPTVVSESRTITSPRKDRRSKTSTTSNATVRGASIQLTTGRPSLPTTQLTTTQVHSNGLTDAEYDSPDLPGSLSRSAGLAVSQVTSDRERESWTGSTRKRTISAVSENSAYLASASASPVSTIPSSATRSSFPSPIDGADNASIASSANRSNTSDSSRGRRGTIGGLFR